MSRFFLVSLSITLLLEWSLCVGYNVWSAKRDDLELEAERAKWRLEAEKGTQMGENGGQSLDPEYDGGSSKTTTL